MGCRFESGPPLMVRRRVPGMLFIDDVRECPEGWDLARTSSEVVEWCRRNGAPDAASFDYDMGDECGADIAAAMISGGMAPRIAFVHSMNPFGAVRLMEMLAGACGAVGRVSAEKLAGMARTIAG